MSAIHRYGILGLVLVGCASSTPPRELVDARVTYARAAQSPDAQYAMADMHDAKLALANAEQRFDKDGDEPETRTAAYVASRKAIIAQAKGETLRNLQEKKGLEVSLARFKDQELAREKGELMRSQQELQNQRSAKSANDAFIALQGVQTHEDQRGLVLTLSGSVLFQSNSSTLMPAAQQRLTDVANALKNDERSISIVGHTDSTGGTDLNQRLSQQRADSVRTFLAEHGVPADRMTTMGAGESQPIADNKSPEGRANNRRVEIILQREGATAPSNGKSRSGKTTPKP